MKIAGRRVVGTMAVAVAAMSCGVGCSLKDLAKADDAGATATASASAAPTAASTAAATDGGADSKPVAKGAAGAAAADGGAKTAAKTGVPTCAKGQVMASEALSPLTPFCAPTCKTDADCTNTACMDVNALTPEGTVPKGGQQFIKVCNPGYPKSATKDAAKDAGAAAAPKCKASEHYDAIDKKCRPEGDCPKGYHWNDPMRSCVDG